MRNLSERTRVARGLEPADLLIRGAEVMDVYSARFRQTDLAVFDGVIVATDPGLKAKRTIEGKGKWVVPGFIDAHVHVESSCLVPGNFSSAVLPRGTTSAICDPHELANVQGERGIEYFLNESERLSTQGALDLWVMMSSCVPATHLESNGGGEIPAAALSRLSAHARALGLAEMMNVPGVLHSDPAITAKLAAFEGRPIDGHCPLLRGKDLAAYALSGITSCHESSELEEAAEKLRQGIAVWIREGSVAKDLDALVPLLTLETSTTLGFCTDDRNPLDILSEGHLDHLIRRAIARGVPPAVAYRAASWSVARHYGLDRVSPTGRERVGALAPGFAADFVILDDLHSCAVSAVYKRGRPTHELGSLTGAAARPENTIRATIPEARDLEGPAGQVHVIGARHGRILTDRLVLDSRAPGVKRLSVLERHGQGLPPANGYVHGFGEGLRGAIVSSVGHDSHNLIGVGEDARDIRAGFAALAECGGGFAVVEGGKVLARLALPFGGLMSERPSEEVGRELSELKRASRAVGCELPEPFLQLAFLSLPVIPSLKLTDRGLVDVEKFAFIDVRAS